MRPRDRERTVKVDRVDQLGLDLKDGLEDLCRNFALVNVEQLEELRYHLYGSASLAISASPTAVETHLDNSPFLSPLAHQSLGGLSDALLAIPQSSSKYLLSLLPAQTGAGDVDQNVSEGGSTVDGVLVEGPREEGRERKGRRNQVEE